MAFLALKENIQQIAEQHLELLINNITTTQPTIFLTKINETEHRARFFLLSFLTDLIWIKYFFGENQLRDNPYYHIVLIGIAAITLT